MDLRTTAMTGSATRLLDGRVAIVTGSTSGIGLSVTGAFDRAGADAVVG